MKRLHYFASILLLYSLLLSGCAKQPSSESTAAVTDTQVSDTEFRVSAKTEEHISEATTETELLPPQEPAILHFVDVFGEEYEVTLNPNVPKHAYNMDSFSRDGQQVSYESDTYTSQLGIDVSHHQGDIDWKQVKDAGYEFAFIRLGYRGYTNGKLCLDRCFFQNIKNAQAHGIEVGVYLFSQAISEEEAIEEAMHILGKTN